VPNDEFDNYNISVLVAESIKVLIWTKFAAISLFCTDLFSVGTLQVKRPLQT